MSNGRTYRNEAGDWQAPLSNGNLFSSDNLMLPPPNINPHPTGDFVPSSHDAIHRRLLAYFLHRRIHGYANLYDDGSTSSGILPLPEAAYGSSIARLNVDPRLYYGYATNCYRTGADSSSNNTMLPSYSGLHAPMGMPLVADNRCPQRLPLQSDNFSYLDFSQINNQLNALTIDASTSLPNPYLAPPRLGNGHGHGAAYRGSVSGDGYKLLGPVPQSRRQWLAASDIGVLARDQYGCKALRELLDSPAALRLVFDAVVYDFAELLNHPIGGELLEILVQKCTDDMLACILPTLEAVPEEVVSSAMTYAGSKVLHTLIKRISKNPDQVASFREMIHSAVLTLIRDQAGSFVLKACLDCFTQEQNWFIFSVVLVDPRRFLINRHSYVVVEQCIDKGDDRVRGEIINVICEHGLELAQHSHGNYVVQHVIRTQPWVNHRIAELLRGQYARLSMQKCSSHVVQRCLEMFAPHHQAEIVRELLDDFRFDNLIQDQYANFVIQTALEKAPHGASQELRAAILPYKEGLRHNLYSRRIFSILASKRRQSSPSN